MKPPYLLIFWYLSLKKYEGVPYVLKVPSQCHVPYPGALYDRQSRACKVQYCTILYTGRPRSMEIDVWN